MLPLQSLKPDLFALNSDGYFLDPEMADAVHNLSAALRGLCLRIHHTNGFYPVVEPTPEGAYSLNHGSWLASGFERLQFPDEIITHNAVRALYQQIFKGISQLEIDVVQFQTTIDAITLHPKIVNALFPEYSDFQVKESILDRLKQRMIELGIDFTSVTLVTISAEVEENDEIYCCALAPTGDENDFGLRFYFYNENIQSIIYYLTGESRDNHNDYNYFLETLSKLQKLSLATMLISAAANTRDFEFRPPKDLLKLP